jgi:hypothetical protein
MIDGSSCVVCCLREVFRDHTYVLHTCALYLDRCASFPRGPVRVYDLTHGNITTQISQTLQMWSRLMPLILIKDEELTYHGKILSVRYEEGRLRAIHEAMCISEHRSRPMVRPHLIMPDRRLKRRLPTPASFPSDTLHPRIQTSL